MSLDKLLDDLATHAPPQTPEDAAAIEKGLGEVVASSETMTDAQIDRLYRMLTDSAKFQEVLWSVMQVIELQERAKHVEAFARNLAYMRDNAPDWAETMVCRIMNSGLGDDLLASVRTHESAAPLRSVLEPLAADKKSKVAAIASGLLDRL